MKTKRCTKCDKIQAINEFNKDVYKSDGLRCQCRTCVKLYDSTPRAKLSKSNYCKSQHGKNIKLKYHKTPDGIYMILKSSAKKRHLDFKLNKKSFANWYNSQNKVCHYCNKTEKQSLNDMNRKMHRLSIDRKDSTKGYLIDNIVLACYKCNMMKSNDVSYEQMIRIGKILEER
jgi:hypothetical protein